MLRSAKVQSTHLFDKSNQLTRHIFFHLSYYYRPIIGGSILYYLVRESRQNQFLQTIRTLRRSFICHAYHFWLYILEVRLIR